MQEVAGREISDVVCSKKHNGQPPLNLQINHLGAVKSGPDRSKHVFRITEGGSSHQTGQCSSQHPHQPC